METITHKAISIDENSETRVKLMAKPTPINGDNDGQLLAETTVDFESLLALATYGAYMRVTRASASARDPEEKQALMLKNLDDLRANGYNPAARGRKGVAALRAKQNAEVLAQAESLGLSRKHPSRSEKRLAPRREVVPAFVCHANLLARRHFPPSLHAHCVEVAKALGYYVVNSLKNSGHISRNPLLSMLEPPKHTKYSKTRVYNIYILYIYVRLTPSPPVEPLLAQTTPLAWPLFLNNLTT